MQRREPTAGTTLTAEWLLSRLSDATGRTFADAAQPLNEAGIDSVDGLQVLGDLEDEFGVTLELAHLLGGATAEGVTAQALALLPRAATEPGAYAGLRGPDGKGETGVGPNAKGSVTLQQERAVLEAETSAAAGQAFRSHIAVAFDVVGATGDKVAEALSLLVERHDALRVSFQTSEGQLTQRAMPLGCWQVERTSSETLSERFEQIARTPFFLVGEGTRELPIRALVCDHDGGATLALVVHHAVSDAASIAVLVRELGALLDAEPLEPAASFLAWAGKESGATFAESPRWSMLDQVVALNDVPVVKPAASLMQPLSPDVWESAAEVAGALSLTRNALLFSSFALATLGQAKLLDAVIDSVSSRRSGGARRSMVGYLAENLAAPLQIAPGVAAQARGEEPWRAGELAQVLVSLEQQRQAAERAGWYRSSLDDSRRRAGHSPLPLSVCFNAQPAGLIEGYRSQRTRIAPSLALTQAAIQHCLGVIGYALPAHDACLLSVVYAPDRVHKSWCEQLLRRWTGVLEQVGVRGW